MSLFKDYITSSVTAGLSNPGAGIPIPFTKLSKYINYIERGKNIVIGGRDTSGKKSFMDYTYFLNIFKWWRDLDMPLERKPQIHFYYFNLTGREKVLVQKWLCLLLKIEFKCLLDVPTLNSQVGRMRELQETDLQAIDAAAEFMNDLEKHLTLVSGTKSPSDISNYMRKEMDKYGDLDEGGVYRLKNEHSGRLTFVLVNDVDRLASETDGFSMLNIEGVKRRFATYMKELRDIYKTTNIWVAPTKDNSPRNPKATEPTYKDLGVFSSASDVGLVMYNPFNECNNKYQGYPVTELVAGVKNRFRTVTVVRNESGPENLTIGLIFLGECGYFTESPSPGEELAWDAMIQTLNG